jgi:uncharacterized protein (TIGR02145 family)
VISFKTVTVICLGATLCAAQTINITGEVKESGGANISGASVKMVKANISTTTGLDGRFTLTNSTGTIHNGGVVSRPVSQRQFEFIRNSLNINCTELSFISIHVFNVSGRQVLSERRVLAAGRHTLSMQNISEGLHIIKITMNNERHAFKTVKGSFTAGNILLKREREDVMTMAKRGSSITDSSGIPDTNNTIIDTVVITREGFISERRYIRDSIVDLGTITLSPVDTNIVIIDTARDFEGNEYPAIRIGKQVWTITNLRSTKYNDGTPIPHVTDETQWSGLSTPAYCFYGNSTDTAFQIKYGALYNWYTVNTGKLVPDGWRVPTNAEWDTLQNYLIANGYNWDGTTSGNKIAKAMAAQMDWSSSNVVGSIGNDLSKNNASGFAALPGGSRFYDGNFFLQSNSGYWWSATVFNASVAWYLFLDYDLELLARIGGGDKGCGYSVRLFRDLD